MGIKRILETILFVELAVAAVICGIGFYLSVLSFLPPVLSLIYIIISVCLYCLGTYYYDFTERKNK